MDLTVSLVLRERDSDRPHVAETACRAAVGFGMIVRTYLICSAIQRRYMHSGLYSHYLLYVDLA